MGLNNALVFLSSHSTHQAQPFSEVEAAKIMKQVFSTLALLHSDNFKVVHRDIKPENLLLRRADKDLSDVVLIDFGLSRFFEPGQRLTTRVGTVDYTAPEVERAGTDAVLIWPHP